MNSGIRLRSISSLPIHWSAAFQDLSADAVSARAGNFSGVDIIDGKAEMSSSKLHDFELLLVPVLDLKELSRVANLCPESLVSSAVISSVIAGTPVIACCEEVNSLNFYVSSLPKIFCDILDKNLSLVKGMGVQLVERKNLALQIQKTLGFVPSGSSILGEKIISSEFPSKTVRREKIIITREDIITAGADGKKRLEFPSGTIITPLAREEAEKLSIEVIIM
ncbi:MAG: hypothetical protein M1536_07935 [Firmicutes bacterium]|nr:hypothetical protein [Bacillota bacterium]